MGGVGGILLDGSALLAAVADEYGNAYLRPGAEYLLRKLRYSNIPTAISYGLDLSAHKVSFLERTAKTYSFDCYTVDLPSIDNTVNEIALAWPASGGSFLLVVSDCNKDASRELRSRGWLIIMLRSVEQGSTDDTGIVGACENSGMLYIDKLEELPLTVFHLNRKAIGNDNVTVGYIMKQSREEDFMKRGAFPTNPTQNGLIFVPITFEFPISSQLQEIDVVLHKATDEIVSVEMSTSSEFFDKITFTRGMQELERYIEHHPNICVVDPLNNVYPVLDRLTIQQILVGLENLNMEGRCKIRAPHFLKVNNFNEPNLAQRLLEAKLTPPSIVKPQVACGVADAHSMAIVFRAEDYSGLSVPLPAVVQEYVDHSSTLYKFYVLGKKVFYAVKKSMPNADSLIKLSEKNGLKPLLFDSLKSLPTAKENQDCGVQEDCKKGNCHQMDLGLVTDAAGWLQRKLDLTIFGFDVVIQEKSGDHVIVDVNYLPSFKEVPDNIAIPAFWDAIKSKYESTRLIK
ncbi:Inositol 1,3,4-trisphosphate 5/6-kinase [Actinidia chinensis var. chinensis]|uniref:Inositol 1,3,4-trisphosphate 5/6-kinase n=1 Tax=Actinidia chinensis var. chinensis TaxID=1590841 RepID=A0A2R6S0G7_ACTCC|nr:Inositol 1,3,4-trisphosphate 5/6-kinase [Actinidia chinensis var. chinensis]